MAISKAKLINIAGLKCVLVTNPTFLKTSIGLIIKTGSANDPKGLNGMAKMVGELLYRQLLPSLDNQGLFSHQINREYSYYSISSITDNMMPIIVSLLSVLGNIEISAKNVAIISKVLINTIKFNKDNINQLLVDTMHDHVFARQVIGKSIVGREKTINNITTTNIKEFYDKYYGCNNAILTICIPASSTVVLGDIEKELTQIITSCRQSKSISTFKRYIHHGKGGKSIYKNTKTNLVSVVFPFKGYKSYNGRIEVEVFKQIFTTRAQYSQYQYKCQIELYNSMGYISFIAGLPKEEITNFIEHIQNEIRNIYITNSECIAARKKVYFRKVQDSHSEERMAYQNAIHMMHVRKVKKIQFDMDAVCSIIKEDLEKFSQENLMIEKVCVFCIGQKVKNQLNKYFSK